MTYRSMSAVLTRDHRAIAKRYGRQGGGPGPVATCGAVGDARVPVAVPRWRAAWNLWPAAVVRRAKSTVCRVSLRPPPALFGGCRVPGADARDGWHRR